MILNLVALILVVIIFAFEILIIAKLMKVQIVYMVLDLVELDLSLFLLDATMTSVLLIILDQTSADINFHSLNISLLFVHVNLVIDMSLIPMA